MAIKLKPYYFDETLLEGLTTGIHAAVSSLDNLIPESEANAFIGASALKLLYPMQDEYIDGDYGKEKISFYYGATDTLYVIRTNVLTSLSRIYAYTYGNTRFRLDDAVIIIGYHKRVYTLDLM